MQPYGVFICRRAVSFPCCTDDTQISLPVKPDNTSDLLCLLKMWRRCESLDVPLNSKQRDVFQSINKQTACADQTLSWSLVGKIKLYCCFHFTFMMVNVGDTFSFWKVKSIFAAKIRDIDKRWPSQKEFLSFSFFGFNKQMAGFYCLKPPGLILTAAGHMGRRQIKARLTQREKATQENTPSTARSPSYCCYTIMRIYTTQFQLLYPKYASKCLIKGDHLAFSQSTEGFFLYSTTHLVVILH